MPHPGTVELTSDGDMLVLHVIGELDDLTGRLLVDLADSAVAGSVGGLTIDLCSVDRFSDTGAAALVACAAIARPLQAGVRYRFGAHGALAVLVAGSSSDRAQQPA